jgi:hypothetical protein
MMTWVFTIFCITPSLYCWSYGSDGIEIQGGFDTEQQCVRHAEELLKDKSAIHQGKFVFEYTCKYKFQSAGEPPRRRQ